MCLCQKIETFIKITFIYFSNCFTIVSLYILYLDSLMCFFNGCDMPAGNAYPSGHLVPSPLLGTCLCSILLIPDSSNLPCLSYSTFHLGTFSILLYTRLWWASVFIISYCQALTDWVLKLVSFFHSILGMGDLFEQSLNFRPLDYFELLNWLCANIDFILIRFHIYFRLTQQLSVWRMHQVIQAAIKRGLTRTAKGRAWTGELIRPTHRDM